MEVNTTPVFNGLASAFLPYQHVWQKQPADKRGSTRLKFAGVSARFPCAPDDYIAMWIADMDAEPPQCVIDALVSQISEQYGYQLLPFADAVADWHNRVGDSLGVNGDVKAHHVIEVPSVISAVDSALRAFCDVGDEVMVLSPTYGPLADVITLNNMRPSPVYVSDSQIHVNTLNENAKAFVLCHPNNPDGAVLTHVNQVDIIRFCEQHNIVLIIDAVHAELGFVDEDSPNAIPLFGGSAGLAQSQNIVHVNSVNKAFNLSSMPGASYAIIAHEQQRVALKRSLSQRHLEAGPVAKAALISAYHYGSGWLQTMRAAIGFNRKLVNTYFAHYGIDADYTMGQATYFLWLNLRKITLTKPASNHVFKPAEDINQCITRGVIVNDGAQFGANGFIRMNLACHPIHIEQALNRLFFSAN